MLRKTFSLLVVLGLACAPANLAEPKKVAPIEVKVGMEQNNPLLLASWNTPFEVPPFAEIKAEHFAPALDEGMRRQQREIETIVKLSEPATFANTLEALDRSGALIKRVENVFFNLTGTDTTDELQAIREKYAPKLAQHRDAITLNAELFARIKAVYDQRESLSLTGEQHKLLKDYYRDFVRAGANLGPSEKASLTETNAKLAQLYTQFEENLRQEMANYALVIKDPKQLAGLPPEIVEAGAAAAKAMGQEGKWAYTLTRSSFTPFLQYATDRELRREIYTAYIHRGANANAFDNQKILKEIALLRAQRAALLGYKTHAHYLIENDMAKNPEAVYGLLNKLWDGATKKAKEERKALETMLKKDLGKKATLEPWDWWFYAEKVRKERFNLDASELNPYFQVDAVRQGAFDTAAKLFGITFKEITQDVPRYHPDVKVFEVTNNDGTHVGLLYVDYFPRPSKRSGAWMSVFRSQSNRDGRVRPIVINVGNFPPPMGDKPALLGWDEVETLFHEFGHALHGLLSDVTYERLSGTNVKRDYVELPSQLMENWAAEPEVIKSYARHYETGAVIPDALVAKIQKAATFNQGFSITEISAAALLDLKWHTLGLGDLDKIAAVGDFDQALAKEIGLISQIAPRYLSPNFQHIFTGDEYSAGYYVYLWAQVLEAEAFLAFKESGNIFNPELAKKLRQYVFAAGGSEEEMDLFVKFRGRAPEVKPLFTKLGFESK